MSATRDGRGEGGPGRLPAAAFAGALAALPGMGPVLLHRLLQQAEPEDVWDAVRRGEVQRSPARRAGNALLSMSALDVTSTGRAGRRVEWAEAARAAPVAAWWDTWRRRGIGVTWPGDDRYPHRLRTDPEPPGVIFWRGDLGRLEGPCVAVVGTRRCSPDGRASAYDMGRDLAIAGVCVVSGLALGIDGAAHLGALDGPPPPDGPGSTVGVAASGVDVAYPARHAALWERVATAGAVISETAPGRPAQAWRFPSRNRVIAGLVDMVVVVESHAGGGSLITADKALERGIEVRVVPGPVHAPCAAGSNQLLYDGPGPVRDAADVLDALGMVAHRPRRAGRRRVSPVARPEQLRLRPGGTGAPGTAPSPPAARSSSSPEGCGSSGSAGASSASGVSPPVDAPPGPDPGPSVHRSQPPAPEQAPAPGPRPGVTTEGLQVLEREVLEAVGWRPTSLNRVIERAGHPVGTVGRVLETLLAGGLVRDDGGWWSRTGGANEGTGGGATR